MSTIGAQSFIGVYGTVHKNRIQTVEISQPFLNGSAFQRIGTRAPDSQLQSSVDVPNEATAAALVRAYEAMVGTVVTIVNHGESKENCLIRDVQAQIIPGLIANGGLINGPFLVDAVWLVRYVGLA